MILKDRVPSWNGSMLYLHNSMGFHGSQNRWERCWEGILSTIKCLSENDILTKRSHMDKANFKMIAKQDISLSQRKAKALVHSTDVFSMTPDL